MNKFQAKKASLKRRQTRIRSKISGSASRPRLRVNRTNAHIYAMLVDDVAGKTLCSASSLDAEFKAQNKLGSNIEAAKLVGELIGKRAQEAGITEVVFDRGGRLYHGRIQALADAARDAGLKF